MEIVVLVAIGFAAGTLGSLLGLGGGFLVVPALILIQGLPARLATGTAVAVIVPTMLVALWRRGIQGHVDWKLALLIAGGAIVGAFLGSYLAGKLPNVVIRRIFAFVLLGLAGILFFTDERKAKNDAMPSQGAVAAPIDGESPTGA